MVISQQTKIALGSEIVLTICSAKNEKRTREIFVELWSTIDDFDNRYSRFRTDSQLTKLNDTNGGGIKVSDEFIDLLKISKDLSQKTGGIFNPLILPVLQKAGYKKSWAPNKSTEDPPDYSDRIVGKMHDVDIGQSYVKIPKNTALDLGGIGKGYLLEKLGKILYELKINNYWLSLGGDILAKGKNAEGEPWKIEIVDYNRPDKTVGFIESETDCPIAIATSGITKRRGINRKTAWHHIIDPRTGRPAKTDIKTVTVCTISAIEADVYASCLVVLGSKKYKNLIKKNNINDILIQTNSKKIHYGSQITLV